MRLAIAIAVLVLALDAASGWAVGSVCGDMAAQYWSSVAAAVAR